MRMGRNSGGIGRLNSRRGPRSSTCYTTALRGGDAGERCLDRLVVPLEPEGVEGRAQRGGHGRLGGDADPLLARVVELRSECRGRRRADLVRSSDVLDCTPERRSEFSHAATIDLRLEPPPFGSPG
jgi:hypothetical protein